MLLRTDETCTIWVHEFPAGRTEWDKYRKRLLRRGASWVRFGVIDAPGIVFGADPMPEGERPFRDADALVARLGETLRVMPLNTTGERIRPISSCEAWKPVDDESDYTRMEWLTVGDPRALAARLEAIGVKCWMHRRSNTDVMLRRTGREYLWDVSFSVEDNKREAIESIMAEFRAITDTE